jgi:plasmid stability protein
MATLTIKNMPDELYRDLKQQAKRNHRSLNSEAIVGLTLVVNQDRTSSQNILLKARALRVKKNSIIELTDEVIKQAKDEGRS